MATGEAPNGVKASERTTPRSGTMATPIVTGSPPPLRSRDHQSSTQASVDRTRKIITLLSELLQGQRETHRLLSLLFGAERVAARHDDPAKGGRS